MSVLQEFISVLIKDGYISINQTLIDTYLKKEEEQNKALRKGLLEFREAFKKEGFKRSVKNIDKLLKGGE